ncbi:host-nuclease inhibitor Gam family protein [Quatrionicoccus australiensis]|uniref:host-nuclease inhibitor Gam family protein n=1 Tax=Quatrionicoccus australiensis TaxID=138118 RepID=UPI001CF851FA|nr:host-nuclease inhibitor Gam family protein [Quatrionicoccus australiensis]UCV13789.1 host-nuclease inhibitor Gam family protein [Quatrionicoccus australiensis]
MSNLIDIERAAKKFAEAREHLTTIVTTMNEGIETIKRDNIKRLKKAVANAAEEHDALKALIEATPASFVKPRSTVFHGIKLGFQKSKGKIDWADSEQVIKLIKKHFPEQADVLIATTEKPVKEALNGLSAAELKKIGCNVNEGGDVVFIKPADSAVDKMVDALLKDATAEVE